MQFLVNLNSNLTSDPYVWTCDWICVLKLHHFLVTSSVDALFLMLNTEKRWCIWTSNCNMFSLLSNCMNIWPIFVCHLQMWKLASNVVNGDFNTKETDVIKWMHHIEMELSAHQMWGIAMKECKNGLKTIYLLWNFWKCNIQNNYSETHFARTPTLGDAN